MSSGIVQFLLVVLLCISSIPGCVHITIDGGRFVSHELGFSVELPDESLTTIKAGGDAIGFMESEAGYSMVISVTEDEYLLEGKTIELKYLARQVFIYVENKEYIVSEAADLGGLPAWHIKVSGEVEGAPLVLEAYVVRKGGLIYDMVLCSPRDVSDHASRIFMDTVNSFEFLDKEF